MDEGLKNRAAKLAEALAAVADEIEKGALTPGVDRMFNFDGAPACAFGHALHRVGANLDPSHGGSNSDGLRIYLNGRYEEEVGSHFRMLLAMGADGVAEANDSEFRPIQGEMVVTCDCDRCKRIRSGKGPNRERVSNALRSLASQLGEIK